MTRRKTSPRHDRKDRLEPGLIQLRDSFPLWSFDFDAFE